MGDDAGRPITAEDIVKRFSKRPFGWNDDEIILIIARLALANKINFQSRQQDVSLKNAFENLTQVRKRAELRVRRIKQQSDANLKRAAKLFKDVFGKNAPSAAAGQVNEKELCNVAQANLQKMKSNLDAYANKASTGHYPGVKDIDNGKVILSGLIEAQSSYQFIERFLASENDLLDFEEDYQDLGDFYESQFATWQKLHKALTIDFDRNRKALEKDSDALAALKKLETIYNKERPYRDIREIEPQIEKVAKVNESMLAAKREHAKSRIEHRVEQVQKQLKETNAPSELSNKALMPLQSSIKRLDGYTGIAEILQEQADSVALEEEAYELINTYIEQQHALALAEAKTKAEKEAAQKAEAEKNKGNGVPYEPEPIEPAVIAEQPVQKPVPKKIVSIDTSSLMSKVSSSGVIESQEDIDIYLSALRDELSALVLANNKVRIK